MKYLKTLEALFSDKVKDTFRGDVYYINKDDYNYPDGFSRYFKRGDIVVSIKKTGYTHFKVGDKFKILRMEGQNAKVKSLSDNKIFTVGLGYLLFEKDLEDYKKYIELSKDINKYNL